MSNTVNQETKHFYLIIKGQEVTVTEDVYRAYKQPLWTEHKRKEREKRCMISNGKGGTRRCTGDCSLCDKQRTGTILSLDYSAEEYGLEPSDPADIEEIIAEKELLRELLSALEELDPENRRIMELFTSGKSERDIATDIGLSQKAVNKRKTKLFAQLKDRLKDFI